MARVKEALGMMERFTRAFDQLDEQLHAGYFFYILTQNTKFVSNSVFIYPAVMIILSFAIPVVIDYQTHKEKAAENKEEVEVGTEL